MSDITSWNESEQLKRMCVHVCICKMLQSIPCNLFRPFRFHQFIFKSVFLKRERNLKK